LKETNDEDQILSPEGNYFLIIVLTMGFDWVLDEILHYEKNE